MIKYCENTLKLSNSKEDIREVLKEYLTEDEKGETVLDFDKILPIPNGLKGVKKLVPPTPELKEIYKQNLQEHGFENEYEWVLENWGTSNYYPALNLEEDYISFETKETPPVPVINKLATLVGKDLNLIYVGSNYAFGGELNAYADGTNEDNYYDEIDYAPEEFLEKIGYDSTSYADYDDEEFEE